MNFKDFVKSNVLNQNNTQDFFDLEKQYNLLKVDRDNLQRELSELKKQFNDSMMNLFIGDSEVAVGQRNFYILIGLAVAQFISLIILLFK